MLCIQNNTKVQSMPVSCKNAQSSKEILVPLYAWMPPLLGVPPLPLPRPKENIKHQQHGQKRFVELLGTARLSIVENKLVCNKYDKIKAFSPKTNILTAISQFGVSKNTCARRDKEKHIFFFFCHAKNTHEFALKKFVFLRYAWFYPDARTCLLKLRTSLY